MNNNLEIDKYFNERKYVYNSSVEINGFNEICDHYGLIQKDKYTYISPKEKLTIIKDVEGYHYKKQHLTISSKNNYIEVSGIPVDENFQSKSIIHYIYEFHYTVLKDCILPCVDETVQIYSLRGLILFLELIKDYGYLKKLVVNKSKKLNKKI